MQNSDLLEPPSTEKSPFVNTDSQSREQRDRFDLEMERQELAPMAGRIRRMLSKELHPAQREKKAEERRRLYERILAEMKAVHDKLWTIAYTDFRDFKEAVYIAIDRLENIKIPGQEGELRALRRLRDKK